MRLAYEFCMKTNGGGQMTWGLSFRDCATLWDFDSVFVAIRSVCHFVPGIMVKSSNGQYDSHGEISHPVLMTSNVTCDTKEVLGNSY